MQVLKVGYWELLFPDNVDAAKILVALSKAQVCVYHDYGDHKVELKPDREFCLSLRVVAPGTRIVQKAGDGEEEVTLGSKGQKGSAIIPRPKRAALKQSTLPMLGNGGAR